LTLKSVDLELVLIPKGTFQMGSPDNEGDSNEHPQHDVEITKPFYMGKTEVTQDQYRLVMGNNPSHFVPGDGKDQVTDKDTGTYPVQQVTYEDARKFCREMALKEGLPESSIRLPTEAEWEYAARANKPLDPENKERLKSLAWFDENAEGRTHPVEQLEANKFGLFDMAGNVWEWCSDWYTEPYTDLPGDPDQDPLVAEKPDEDARRVLRGGSWDADARRCRTTERNAAFPDFRDEKTGFRIVLEADAAPHPGESPR